MANDRDYGFSGRTSDRDDDYGRNYNAGRDDSSSSMRGYGYGGGDFGDREDRNYRGGGTGYGGDRGNRPDTMGGRETYGSSGRDYYGGSSDDGRGGGTRQSYGGDSYGGGGGGGGFGSAGERDRGQSWSQRQGQSQGGDRSRRDRDHGRAPQGYDYQDRGFMARAGDEVRSWFGDEDAERRREQDQRYDERMGGGAYGRDEHYHNWRKSQIDALDRDYHEYRRENAKRFESEFGAWRSNRQTQRQSLGQVREHMDVVGSDGGHVGTVDKVRGDRIILTKNDADAGGRHHSIPSSWIQSVDDKVTISKSADEAHEHWRDEEGSGAMFGGDERAGGRGDDGNVNLNRSFSGTY